MKLSKKVLAAFSMVAALAMAVSFTSCADEEDENGVIEVSGNKATVNYTNESSTEYARAFRTLKQDRTDATCKITIDRAKSKGNGGVVGFMFNESKAKVTDDDIAEGKEAIDAGNLTGVTAAQLEALKGKEYYDFSIAGIGLTAVGSSGNVRTYVSVFEMVDPSSLESGKNFLDLLGDDAESVNVTKDKVSIADSNGWVVINDYTATDNVYTIYIKMAVQTDGSIKLDYYKDSDYTNNVLNDSATALQSITIDAEDTGLDSKKDGGIGFYANVYGSSTLVGSWEFFDLAGNAIAIEE